MKEIPSTRPTYAAGVETDPGLPFARSVYSIGLRTKKEFGRVKPHDIKRTSPVKLQLNLNEEPTTPLTKVPAYLDVNFNPSEMEICNPFNFV